VIRGTDRTRGTLTTRPVRFSGAHLFVNADVRGGELRAEVLDEQGRALPSFTADASSVVSDDRARAAITWRGADLASVANRPVRFRFAMTRGRLYSFWVSQWPSGESNGYPAAGGPAFEGPIDRPAR
jgi:hypothetical protein